MLLYPVPNDGSLHVGSFMRRAVEPSLKDLQHEFVRNEMAFRVRMLDPERDEGRGRPIQKLIFEVTPRTRGMNTLKAARLSTVEMNVVRESDPELEWNELPGQLLVGRAMTRTGMDGVTLIRGWRAAVKSAKADPNGEVLGALSRADHGTRKGSLTNLALALRDWDMERVRRIAGAILGSAKSGGMPLGRSRVGRPVRPRSFIATRQMTEADTETDFLDPVYAAGATSWDDRCASDLEPADDCPF